LVAKHVKGLDIPFASHGVLLRCGRLCLAICARCAMESIRFPIPSAVVLTQRRPSATRPLL
jgi:hypothetical protein